MIDCHAHVVDPARFPFGTSTYRPTSEETGTVEDYLAVLDAAGVRAGVAVQPTSGYDDDHACLLHALALAPRRLRGIVRLSPRSPGRVTALLDAPGVAGVRLDLVHDGTAHVAAPAFASVLAALAERGKRLDIQCERDQLADVLPSLAMRDLTIVVDHCGRPDPARGLAQPGFAALLELGRRGHFVKLSGTFRFSHEAWPFADTDAFVERLLQAFPMRCVWGSDWPFLRLSQRIDFPSAQALASRWGLDPAAADAAGATLFGFDRP